MRVSGFESVNSTHTHSSSSGECPCFGSLSHFQLSVSLPAPRDPPTEILVGKDISSATTTHSAN